MHMYINIPIEIVNEIYKYCDIDTRLKLNKLYKCNIKSFKLSTNAYNAISITKPIVSKFNSSLNINNKYELIYTRYGTDNNGYEFDVIEYTNTLDNVFDTLGILHLHNLDIPTNTWKKF